MKRGLAHQRICVIGAGSSGLAALRALVERGFDVDCFERGSRVGGNWRYENDSGTSSAYASLRTNVSRERMQYPSFPMLRSFGDYVHHTDMAAYLEAYAAHFGLKPRLRFRTAVETLSPLDSLQWNVHLSSGEQLVYDSVIVANGHDWSPNVPDVPGRFAGETLHAHHYRTPDRFAGQRVLVVGAGQSAVELATEVSAVARRTLMAVRHGRHVVPRYLFGRPADAFDQALPNRLPWAMVRSVFGLLVYLSTGRSTRTPLHPTHHALECEAPVLTDALLPAVRRGVIALKPGIDRLAGDRVHFADGSEEIIDAIIYATGYRIAFPFLAAHLVRLEGKRIPLYRRIVAPDVRGLYFIGLIDPFGGLPAVVEAQSAWLADVLAGRLPLPSHTRMCEAIRAGERRARRRFGPDPSNSLLADRHEYLRILRRDQRRGRWAMRRHQLIRRLLQPARYAGQSHRPAPGS